MATWWHVIPALAVAGCLSKPTRPLAGDAATGSDGPPGPGDASVTANLLFVTSTTVAASTFASVADADAHCTSVANGAGLSGTYVAWLSGTASGQRAIDRLQGARGWQRFDGLPIADDRAQLMAHHLWYPPDLDERGKTVADTVVATGTDIDGTAKETCTALGGGGNITLGRTSGTGSGWTTSTNDAAQACTTPFSLYCLGTDKNVVVAAPHETGRRAFVSKKLFSGTSGLAGADKVCNDDATAANLPGTYLALLPTMIATSRSRFSTTGSPWVRVDGAYVTADLVTFRTSIAVQADGTAVDDVVLTGAQPDQLPSNAFYTCADWTGGNTSAQCGGASFVRPELFDIPSCNCDNPQRVYCFEQ